MAFLSLLLFCLVGCKTEDRDLDQRNADVDSLSTELEKQKQQNDSLQRLVENRNESQDIPIYYGREFDSISNPEEFISNTLRQQRDLIPMEGVLGGNMEFRQVEVISEEWVLAIYDDGHIQGKSIFEYELQPDGELKFTEVAFKRPN